MGSKRKKPPLDFEAAGDLREILAGMAQLLEWMEQLLNAARTHVAAPSGPADRPPSVAGGPKHAGPQQRRGAGHKTRRDE